MTTLARVCAPDLDISLDVPSGWVANPYRHDLFACPAAVERHGEKKLLSCALTIQDVEWFGFGTKDKPESSKYSPGDMLQMYFASERTAAELDVRLVESRDVQLEGCAAGKRVILRRNVNGYPMKLLELHAARTTIYRGSEVYRLNNISLSVLETEIGQFWSQMEHIVGSTSFTSESAIGICFDIARLESAPNSSNYAKLALTQFCDRVDENRLDGSILRWGDTLDTNDFCLKIVTYNPAVCPYLRAIFGNASNLSTLAPLERRFVTGPKLKAYSLPIVGDFSRGTFVRQS